MSLFLLLCWSCRQFFDSENLIFIHSKGLISKGGKLLTCVSNETVVSLRHGRKSSEYMANSTFRSERTKGGPADVVFYCIDTKCS